MEIICTTEDIMKTEKRNKILERVGKGENLPALSPLAVQLVELAASDYASTTDLASTIEKDPSLTTRLLKIVGSALYRGTQPPKSITQAIVRLGFNQVRTMALSLSLRDTFPMDAHEGLDYTHYWKTSLYRALAARSFSQAIQRIDPDEAFVAGLISEVGMLMLLHACEKEDKDDFPKKDLSLIKVLAWEEARFGINHKELASIVLKQWNFPATLLAVQQWYGAKALEPDAPPLCRVVELAGQATEIAYEHTAGLHQLQQLIQTHLGLAPEAVNTIIVMTFSRVEELAGELLIRVNSQKDILAVMEKANQALARMNASIEHSLLELLEHMDSARHRRQEPSEKNKEVLQNALDAVAHEIRNPLLAIGGFAKRLAEEEKGEARGKKYAQIIAAESNRLEQVLEEIMGYCQDYQPQWVTVDLITLLNDILDVFEEDSSKKRIKIVRNFGPTAVSIRLDKIKITETLTRLLEFSTTMAEQGGHTVMVSVQPIVETGEVSILIEDDGSPFPKEAQDALLDNNLTARTLGSVFKLSLAKKIIEAHHGHIALEVEEGRGNALSVRLPAK